MEEALLLAKKSTLLDMQVWVMEQLVGVNNQLLTLREDKEKQE